MGSLEEAPCNPFDLKTHRLEKCTEIGCDVWQGILHGDDHRHAISLKQISLSKQGMDMTKIKEKVKHLKQVSKSKLCRNVCVIHDVGLSDDHILLVMDFYSKSLASVVTSMNAKDILRITKGIVDGLWHLCTLNYMCVGLDASSILLDEDDIPSIAHVVEPNKTKYMPPEVLERFWTPNEASVSWSFGCLFLEMCTGYQLWDGVDEKEVISSMQRKELPESYKNIDFCGINLPPDQIEKMKSIINGCLGFDASKRPTLDNLRKSFLHLCLPGDDADDEPWSTPFYWREEGSNTQEASKTLLNWEKQMKICLKTDDVEHLRNMLALRKDDLGTLLAEKDADGNSLLHLACKQGSAKCIEELLEHGADGQVLDGKEQNILHVLASLKNFDHGEFKILQKFKGHMCTLNSMQKTPLHLCIESSNLELITKWIEITTQDERKKTIDKVGPAGSALCMAVMAAASTHDKEDIEIVRTLLDGGADPTIRDDKDDSPLHIAVMHDDRTLVQLILAGRTHLKDIKSAHGTPLQVALRNDAVECIPLLLKVAGKEGISPQDEDDEGDTWVHIAARGNYTQFFEKFTLSKVDLRRKNNRGETPIDFLKRLPLTMKNQLPQDLRTQLDLYQKKEKESHAYFWDTDPLDRSYIDVAKYFKNVVGKGSKVYGKSGIASSHNTLAAKTSLSQIEGLVDAKFAGGTSSNTCTLIITEGDSAACFAMMGIDKVLGRDTFGTYALRGKSPNVKGDDPSTNYGNQYKDIIAALGLTPGKQTDIEEDLRYGHVVFMTDQDFDGFHIKGLLLNFFHMFYPDLLKRATFFQDFTTPLICGNNKVTGDIKLFKTLNQFEIFWESAKKSKNSGEWGFKYCKGLASHDDAATLEYFQDYKHHIRNFYWSPGDDNWLELAFSKEMVARRRYWISRHKEGSVPHSNPSNPRNISYGHFVREEFILYAIASIQQSIPSAIDGLKRSQRKVLFELLKLDPGELMEVPALVGRVVEHMAYHHGPQSLSNLIAKMAEKESNNINIIGSGGASVCKMEKKMRVPDGRYLSVFLPHVIPILFPEQDKMFLDYVQADGKVREPQRYVPILPMVLINGCEGLAYGYSCNVPPHKPTDVIKNIRRLMQDERPEEMTPWYSNFKGTINRISNATHEAESSYTYRGGEKLAIIQIPMGKTEHTYMTKVLDPLKEKKLIKGFRETRHSGFEIILPEHMHMDPDSPRDRAKLVNLLELRQKITSQFNLLNAKGKVVSFESSEEVLEHFFYERLKVYQNRKIYLISQLRLEMEDIEARIKQINDAQLSASKFLESAELKARSGKLMSQVEMLENAAGNEIEFQWWNEDLEAFEKATPQLL